MKDQYLICHDQGALFYKVENNEIVLCQECFGEAELLKYIDPKNLVTILVDLKDQDIVLIEIPKLNYFDRLGYIKQQIEIVQTENHEVLSEEIVIEEQKYLKVHSFSKNPLTKWYDFLLNHSIPVKIVDSIISGFEGFYDQKFSSQLCITQTSTGVLRMVFVKDEVVQFSRYCSLGMEEEERDLVSFVREEIATTVQYLSRKYSVDPALMRVVGFCQPKEDSVLRLLKTDIQIKSYDEILEKQGRSMLPDPICSEDFLLNLWVRTKSKVAKRPQEFQKHWMLFHVPVYWKYLNAIAFAAVIFFIVMQYKTLQNLSDESAELQNILETMDRKAPQFASQHINQQFRYSQELMRVYQHLESQYASPLVMLKKVSEALEDDERVLEFQWDGKRSDRSSESLKNHRQELKVKLKVLDHNIKPSEARERFTNMIKKLQLKLPEMQIISEELPFATNSKETLEGSKGSNEKRMVLRKNHLTGTLRIVDVNHE